MDGKRTFEKYYNRLAREGIIKAAIYGVIIGFAVNFIIAFATWFSDYNGLWISIGAGVAAIALSAPLMYFRIFKPTAAKIARRIDALGLEERLITMVELENDQSYIAMRQREDAKSKLAAVETSEIKYRLPVIAIIAAAFLVVLGVGMTTLTSLSAEGKVPGGGDIIDNLTPPDHPEYISVTYMVEDGGIIEGESDQLVLYGEDCTPVLAVADDGWMFVQWSDGQITPARTDKGVIEDVVIYAEFERVEEASADSSDSSEEGDGDEADDLPGEQQSGGNPSEDPGNGSSGAGGRYDDNNQIEDGETYYRDKYEQYYNAAMEKLANGEELTEEERAFIEAYLDIIR